MALPSAKPLHGYLAGERQDALWSTPKKTLCFLGQAESSLKFTGGGRDPLYSVSAGLHKLSEWVPRSFFTSAEQLPSRTPASEQPASYHRCRHIYPGNSKGDPRLVQEKNDQRCQMSKAASPLPMLSLLCSEIQQIPVLHHQPSTLQKHHRSAQVKFSIHIMLWGWGEYCIINWHILFKFQSPICNKKFIWLGCVHAINFSSIILGMDSTKDLYTLKKKKIEILFFYIQSYVVSLRDLQTETSTRTGAFLHSLSLHYTL